MKQYNPFLFWRYGFVCISNHDSFIMTMIFTFILCIVQSITVFG